MAKLTLTITLHDGRLTVTEAGAKPPLLSTAVAPRSSEETARLVAKLVGMRIADAISEEGGNVDG